MINLDRVLLGEPILITSDIYFYQPTLKEITSMGESFYWSLTNIWTLKRKDLIAEETEDTKRLDDFELWYLAVLSSAQLRETLTKSCQILLKTKIEFFDISHTIYIGEKASGIILDATFYLLMKELCNKITPEFSASEEGKQYRKTEHMSERERRLIEKIEAGNKKVESLKNQNQSNPEDYLGRKILGLVAVGHYTFEQVYNMTMLQFNLLLQKYVEIQSYELRTELSPYISSDDSQNELKFWLD